VYGCSTDTAGQLGTGTFDNTSDIIPQVAIVNLVPIAI
jgi:hypothetical protein